METIRQSIRTDTEVGLLITEGDKLVSDISGTYTLLCEAINQLTEFKANGTRMAKNQVDEIEGEIAFEIKNDTTLKNADQRKNALMKRCKEDLDWQAAKKELQKAEQTENRLNQSVIEREHCVKIARYYFDVWKSRMAVMAGLSNEQQEHRHHLIAGANVTIGGNHAKETD